MDIPNKFEYLVQEIKKFKDFAIDKSKDISFSNEYAYGMYNMSYFLYGIAQRAVVAAYTDKDRFNYVFDIIKRNLQTHKEQLCVRNIENHNGRMYVLETLVTAINTLEKEGK